MENARQPTITDQPNGPLRGIKYNPQLDGLRFFPVFFVVCFHWLPSIAKYDVSFFFIGFANFFFVLSSYLITKILLSAKVRGLAEGISKFKIILVFVLRRTIRIFPAYYIYLLLLFLIPFTGNDVKNNAGYYFSYLTNYHIFNIQQWPAATAQLWTLAIEEQFYLIWPFIILFVPHRHLLKTFVCCLGASLLLRGISFQPSSKIPQQILTQYCLDPLAIGGILAYKYTIPEQSRLPITKVFNTLVYLSFPLLVLIIFTKNYYFSFLLSGLLYSILSQKIIDGAILGYSGFRGNFLQKKVIRYIGKISYGIYLYHLVIPFVFWKLFDYAYAHLQYHFPGFFSAHQRGIMILIKLMASETGCFILYMISTLLLATFSWYVIEKPINNLKMPLGTAKKKIAVTNTAV